MITIDFETFYSKDFSLAKMTTEAYINDPQFEVIGVSVKKDDGEIVWITGDDACIRDRLSDLHLEKETVLAHNAVFDCAILSWHYGIVPQVMVDTLSMSRPITGLDVGGSLRALAERFELGHKGDEIYNTLGKHRLDFTAEELARFGEYCRKDVELTYKLYFKLQPFIPVREMYLIDLVLRMYISPKVELDIPLLQKHLDDVRAKKAALLHSIGADTREDIMSNQKFAEMLRSLGVEPPMKVSPTTGKETYAFAKTDEEFKALASYPDERVQALVTARLGLKSTIEETRTEAFLGIAKRMGRMPVMLNYYGATNTGRFSGGDRVNPQNLPRGGVLREAMKAPAGYKIVACDSSNVEARTLAWFAGQDDLVDEFAKGVDVYSSFASKVYGRPITKHENPTERFVGKTCVLGLGYSVGPGKLQGALRNGQIRVEMELDQCREIVNTYRTSYSMITKLWRDCTKALNDVYHGYDTAVGVGVSLPVKAEPMPHIELPNGMWIRYPDLRSERNPETGYDELTYQARKMRKRIYGGAMTENIVQALARIVVSYQMCAIKRELDRRSHEKNDGRIRQIVNMVHDEVVAIVPEDEAQWCAGMMTKCMSTPPKWAASLPVTCEAGMGDNYGEAK